MKISIISTSQRENSQTSRIAKIIENFIVEIDSDLIISRIDMFDLRIPLWTSEKERNKIFWEKRWNQISSDLKSSDGFIYVVPEYGGMATPNSKNFFLLCNKGELSHKPGLLISISSGNGGSYPISELRSSSYKNSHILWIPENIIIRNVEQYNPGNHGNEITTWLDKRIDYCLNLLLGYSKYLVPVQKHINKEDFKNGM